jgi:hypothetical protein
MKYIFYILFVLINILILAQAETNQPPKQIAVPFKDVPVSSGDYDGLLITFDDLTKSTPNKQVDCIVSATSGAIGTWKIRYSGGVGPSKCYTLTAGKISEPITYSLGRDRVLSSRCNESLDKAVGSKTTYELGRGDKNDSIASCYYKDSTSI